MTVLSVPHASWTRRPARGGRRVLLAPVTVTPTKPLTPSHLKGLLWTDVLFRATRVVAETGYRYSNTAYHSTEQTLGFWEFLDDAGGDTDYAAMTEEQIGELYVRYWARRQRPSAAALRPYRDAVEHGWVHPASARIQQLWSAHFRRLGLHDPGLSEHQPPGYGLAEVFDHLAVRGLCLDHRAAGGPVYLDLTRAGLPLRQIVTADGQPNYLACALRDLLPLAVEHDEIVLVHDRELDLDYRLLAHVLANAGPIVHRLPIGRVPIEDRVRSARSGDWRGHTVAALIDEVAGAYRPEVFRLGLRLYFIATLGPGQRQSYRLDLLHKSLHRAERLLDAAPAPAPGPLAERLGQHRGSHAHVNPYRLTTGLLARHRHLPSADLLAEVFL
ncbi:hypothetical protein ABZ342_48470 [Amycolatopsis sp. NPDC005961]|uniref:hypothetical protein n=1 Tax=Amycolatopsis sp. NPDC005961 TaxID=3156720 RepID=UPI00340B40C1